MDIQQIASELGVSEKTVRRLFSKYESKTGQSVGQEPDKSDARRKIYDMEDVNLALDFCGYPLIAVRVEPARTSREVPTPPTEVEINHGWATVYSPSAPVSINRPDFDRQVATMNVATKRQQQECGNLEVVMNHVFGDRVALNVLRGLAQIDAATANSMRNLGGLAVSVAQGDEQEAN